MFNVNDVTTEMENEVSSMGLLAEGWYNMIVIDSNKKANKAGNGEYIELVLQPEGSKRKMWYYFNISHTNPQVAKMGLVALKKFCLAVNKNGFTTASELLDLMLCCNVEHKKDKDGKTRDTITEFAPYQQQVGNNEVPF
jgi:hypothetical protein